MLTFIQRQQAWKDTQEKAKLYSIAQASQKYQFDETYTPSPQCPSTTILVEDIDTIEAGQFLKDQGLNPLVLLLADPTKPGGDVDTGAGGQAESIFRRSNYCDALPNTPEFFPIGNAEAIYSPGLTVFKATELYGYQDIQPFQMDFVACPGIPYPVLTPDGDLHDADKATLEKKIETIFQIAAKNGYKSLVLGPLGCGALRNTARPVAYAFQRMVSKWQNVFQKIIFACLTIDKQTFISLDTVKNMSGVNHTVFSIVFRDPS
jgi:uncharacterized protein (TIGR02452 family)